MKRQPLIMVRRGFAQKSRFQASARRRTMYETSVRDIARRRGRFPFGVDGFPARCCLAPGRSTYHTIVHLGKEMFQ